MTKDQLPDQVKEHLDAIISIFAETASQQALKADELQKMDRDTKEKRKAVKLALSEAKDNEVKTKNRFLEADGRYEEADRIAAYFEQVADQERKDMENETRKQERIKGEIKVERKEIDSRLERAKEQERLVDDKRRSLDRSYRELQAKAKRLGMTI